MNISHTIGRRRACAACSRKFTDTDELVVADRDGDNVFCWNPNNGSRDDEGVCVRKWMKAHECMSAFVFIGLRQVALEVQIGPALLLKKLCEVEAYFTWPPDGELVT